MNDTPDRLMRQAFANGEAAWKAAGSAGEMWAAAGWTILFRMALIGSGTVSGRVHRGEMRRMVTEKVEAAGECATHAAHGLGDMQMHLAEAWWKQTAMSLDVARLAFAGGPDAAGRAHDSALAAAWSVPMAMMGMFTRSYARSLQPYHRRTTRNVKRLSKRRPG